MTCPKCRKAFRKEQNFKLHFDCCQKYSESAEIPIQEADDTTELIENDYDDVFVSIVLIKTIIISHSRLVLHYFIKLYLLYKMCAP